MNLTRLSAALLLGTCLALAQAQPAPPALQGEVLETLNVEGYTYLRLKTASGEMWAAVPSVKVTKGSMVSIARPMMMQNFESKSLGRRFERIAFGELSQGQDRGPVGGPTLAPGAGGAAGKGAGTMVGGPPSVAPVPGPTAAPAPSLAPAPAPAPAKPVQVAKASGPDGKTVAEVVTGKAKLKDKTVVVRGEVVKVNNGIMGKNWLHLRDGSGQAADGSNDLLVTTTDSAALGDVVSARGTVRTDVTVGPGYAYAVMVEAAKLSK